MFEELLTQAIDADTTAKVHPSFAHLISQLSRDEAIILYRLRSAEFKVVDTLDYDRAQNKFENRKIEESTLPSEDLQYPHQIELYYSHLESLNLVKWPVEKQDAIVNDGIQTGLRRYSTMHLTEFGQLFVSVCVPEGGFGNVQTGHSTQRS